MTSDQYRKAIAELGLSQVGAAKALGINPRTSRKYAKDGAPTWVLLALRGLQAVS